MNQLNTLASSPLHMLRSLLKSRSLLPLVCVWSLALLLATAAAFRTVSQYQPPGPFDESRLGFCDFHNGVYFPTKAWLQGDIPYSQHYADNYPVMRQIPLFSPLLFITHVPIALLPLNVAEGFYFVAMLCMILASAKIIFASIQKNYQFSKPNLTHFKWLGIGTAVLGILLSRPAQTTLLSGYFTFELTLGTLLIFYFDDKRSWVASLALAYSSIKPTFAIPLGILLLAMGRFPVVLRGTLLAAVGAFVGVLWMAMHVSDQQLNGGGPGGGQGLADKAMAVVDSMLNSQDVHRNQNWSRPAVSWTRIDLYGLYAKWTRTDPGDAAHLMVMLLLLAPVSYLLWVARKREPNPGLLGLSTAVAILSISVSMYKHVYDAIPMLAVGIAALASCAAPWNQIPKGIRLLMAVLALFPLYNYTSTRMFLNRLPQSQVVTDVLTSVNSVIVLVLWLMLIYYLAKWTYRPLQN